MRKINIPALSGRKIQEFSLCRNGDGFILKDSEGELWAFLLSSPGLFSSSVEREDFEGLTIRAVTVEDNIPAGKNYNYRVNIMTDEGFLRYAWTAPIGSLKRVYIHRG